MTTDNAIRRLNVAVEEIHKLLEPRGLEYGSDMEQKMLDEAKQEMETEKK